MFMGVNVNKYTLFNSLCSLFSSLAYGFFIPTYYSIKLFLVTSPINLISILNALRKYSWIHNCSWKKIPNLAARFCFQFSIALVNFLYVSPNAPSYIAGGLVLFPALPFPNP